MAEPQSLLADRYRLVRQVGSGGMGVVWEAWDERLERPVAVKQLRPQHGLAADEAELAKNRAMREARITARLHHRNAVPVFDVVEHEGQPCLIMQFLPSVALSAELREGGPLGVHEAAKVGAQVASALAAAHQLGIVHRDVKPGNILITDDGTALISDFGISHALGDTTLTSTGLVHGTPAYLAPEVARGGESSFASDVFSLGATLYTCLEGAPPFGTDSNSIALLYRVASGDFAPPQRAGALTPVLEEMLRSDPEARPTMREAAARLARVEAQDAASASTLPLPAAGVGSGAAPESSWTTQLRPDGLHPTPTVVATGRPAPTVVQPAVGAARVGAATVGAGTAGAGTVAGPTSAGAGTVAGPTSAGPGGAAADPPVLPPSGGAPPPPGRRRRRAWALAAAALLVGVVVLAATLVAAQLGRTGTAADPAPTAARSSAPTPAGSSTEPAPSASASASAQSATPSDQPSPSATASRATRSPSPSASPSRDSSPTPGTGAPTASELEDAIRTYYGLVPRDTDAAWPLMTADYQRTRSGGRQAYERFWGAVDRVSTSRVDATPPSRVDATITYRRGSSVSVERTSFRLVREDGVLKIAESNVVSSS